MFNQKTNNQQEKNSFPSSQTIKQLQMAAIIFLIMLTIITDYVSIASILLYMIVPCLPYYSENYSYRVIACTLIILVIGICKHWVNIQNLLAGNETGFRSVFKKNE